MSKSLVKLLILFLCICTQVSCLNTDQKNYEFAPAAGKTLLFIGQDKDTVSDYVQATGHTPTGVMVYTSIQEARGLDEPVDYGSGILHAQVIVDKYPQASIQIGLYMVGALEEILKGQFDSNIDKIGTWIIKSNRLVYVRIGYEFDLPQNGYNPELYKKAFRYIVDRWRSEGVRASYVWHSYGHLHVNAPMMDWYPGDDYVDWFGISFFNAFNDGDVKWMVNRAKEHKKPLMLAEASPFGHGTQKGERSWNMWFKGFFETIEKYDIAAACYINSNWETMPMWKGQGWGDSRVQGSMVKSH
jgi:hypothetical protein